MSAGVYPLRIEKGATFRRSITWKNSLTGLPVDLTGYTARAQIRTKPGAADPAMADLTVDFDADRTTGKLTISLTATQTGGLTSTGPGTLQAAAYAWDLELVSGAEVVRLLQGPVTVAAEVTKP